MKKIFHFPIFVMLLIAASLPSAHALDVGVSHAVYATPEESYLEINIEVAHASITFKPMDSLHLQAGVNVLILIKQDEKVITFEKYVLQSPLVGFPQDLLDVKRMFLPSGAYSLEVTFEDMHDPNNSDTYKANVTVSAPTTTQVSDIQLLRGFRPDESSHPFTKNGYFLEPLPFNFYDKNSSILAFYAELYHTDKGIKDPSYNIRYFVEQDKGNNSRTVISVGNQQKSPSVIDAVLVQMDISKFESGNYWLTVEIRNNAHELVSSKTVGFQRANPFLNMGNVVLTDEMMLQQFTEDLDEDNLRYCMKALGASATGDQPVTIKEILKGGDLKQMRFYVFRHFVSISANNPTVAYNQFMEIATAAHQKFKSGFRFGFETDRGRTYMKYGRPDDLIHVEDDPSAPPYEVWVYYTFPKTKQQNVKFLFYNPTLAGEDFILLHSNARGEINNPKWERELYKRNAGQEFDGDNFHDATQMKSNFGRNARTYFEDF